MWQDVLADYEAAKATVYHALNSAWKALITAKDFLLARSRSFSVDSD